MIRLFFIRHGATPGNLERRYIGCTDEELSEEGIRQAERLRECLKSETVDRVMVSPMLRTQQTARILFPHLEPEIVPDFRETDFGLFEGKTALELSDSPEYRAWVDSMCLDPIPEGESVSEFKKRCCRAFEEHMKTVPDGSCVSLVVHGGVIMAVLEAFAEPKQDFYSYHIGPGNCLMCTWDGRIRVGQQLPGNS